MLEKARTLDLDKSQYQAKLGIAHSINNSLNLAKPSFQETVRLKPSNLSAHYNFAPCLFNIRESESAVVEDHWILKNRLEITRGLRKTIKFIKVLFNSN